MNKNRNNFWNEELKKYGELSKNEGKIKDSISPALTTSEVSKTQGRNPLDIYKNYIKGTDHSSSLGLTDKPQLNDSSSNSLAKYKDLSSIPSLHNTTVSQSKESTATPSNNFSAKYQGTDFSEWYKANYRQDYDPSTILSRRDGMADVDWDIGNSLYETYLKDQQRKNDFESRMSDLDKSRIRSQQNASITLDKLKKYLPTQIKAQGLGGLGVSESSLLNAYNNYTSDMGAIENDYQDRKSSLEEAYAQDNFNSWLNSKDSVSGIFDKYKTSFENNQKQAYENAYNTISQSSEKDESAILKYIEQFRNRLSDSDFFTLTQQAKQVAQANKQAYDKEQEAKIESDRQNAYVVAQATVEDLIAGEEYEKAKEYLDSNKDILGEQVYNSYMTNIESKLKKADDEKIKDYFIINKLSNGNQIKALHSSKAGSVAWHDDHADNFGITVNGKTYGFEMGDEVAKSEQTEIKDYLKAANGRNPQEGDACYYNGQIVVVCSNGNLRYAKDRSHFWAWNWGAGYVNDLISAVNYD